MVVFANPDRHRVAVLVRDGLLPLQLGIAHRLFGIAATASGEPLYELATCAPRPGAVPAEADFSIDVRHGLEALREADTVVVPAASEHGDVHGWWLATRVLAAFHELRPGTRVASICTGAFVLAAAGLLDGRAATTHWRLAGAFREMYPQVRLDADVLYVDEGDVLTSAGAASGIDLCLHMIRNDHGPAVANQVARATVVPPYREGGQAQFIPPRAPTPPTASTSAARGWALEHLHEPLRLRDLADRERMSVRTFTRRFRDEVGVSPLQWVTQQRVQRARQLLEDTDLPIDRIALDVGFGTAASLRQHLQAAIGVSPSTYRSTFRGPTMETSASPAAGHG